MPASPGFARNFHLMAVELGGLMIKVGQFLSSRLDVLPPEITEELEGLQDEVPPVPFPAIRALAEEEPGAGLEQVFAFVEEAPVAAASLGAGAPCPPSARRRGGHRARQCCAEGAAPGH